MARQEQDREDLLREATALVERVELRVAGLDEPVVAGFRRSGEGAVYFGADPVFQFNLAGELRRVYWNGKLVKAERGQLVFLRRERTGGQSSLVREAVGGEAEAACLRGAAEQLELLRSRLEAGQFECVGQVPPDADVTGRLATWLGSLPRPPRVAAVPNVDASAGSDRASRSP